jgi:acyl carrier protein
MPDQTIERLRQLIATKLDANIKIEEIEPSTALLESGLKLNSLAIVDLITYVEEEFGVQFGEDDLNMDSFASVQALANVIDSHKA